MFPTDGGVPWSDHTSCFFCAVAHFFRPGYHDNLVGNWLPAPDGVVDSCSVVHPNSIGHAQAHAREPGVTADTRFEVARAKGYPERDFDLVAFYDCLHDMGHREGRGPCLPILEAGWLVDDC